MRTLKENNVAYRNLSCLEVITHIDSNYYKTNPVSLKVNSSRMISACDVNQPFETFINQIETAVNFSDAGRFPFTPE